jgi:hypothetical protein
MVVVIEVQGTFDRRHKHVVVPKAAKAVSTTRCQTGTIAR